MTLLPRIALGLLGLSFGSSLACQMSNPAFNLDIAGDETRGSADTLDTLDTNSESNSSTSTGDGDATGDGDPTTGDGDPTTGDGDPTTGDGDPTTGDGDPTTGDGDPTTGDGDGDLHFCGDGTVDPGEECDDGNANEGDGCSADCTEEGSDTDIPVLDMMAQECVFDPDPASCHDCVYSFCCFQAPMACLENPTCMCVVECLLGGQNGEAACYQQICMADGNDAALIDAAYPCMQDNCSMQCQGG